MKAKDLAYLKERLASFAPVSAGVMVGANQKQGAVVFELLEMPQPPDQKKPFTNALTMVTTQYEGFGFQDCLVEFISQVNQSLPSGLEVLAVVINGQTEPLALSFE